MLLELFSEPDIFGFQWASTNVYNGVIYPALPDLYGPTMNVRHHLGGQGCFTHESSSSNVS